jgi:hypothetical protein
MRATRATERQVAAALLALLCCVPPAAAVPLEWVRDAAGDQSVQAGELVVQPPAFGQVDLRTLAIDQPDMGRLVLSVTTTSPPTATSTVSLGFRVVRGPQSLPSSTASGAAYNLTLRGGQAAGVEGATVVVEGATQHLTLPLSAIGAVGGDLLAGLVATASDRDEGSAPPPVQQDDSSATDRAPDTGTARDYTFARPAQVGRISLTVLGGTVASDRDEAQEFTGAAASVSHGAGVRLVARVQVANAGIDPDTVTVQGPQGEPGATATVPAGGSATLEVPVLSGAEAVPSGTQTYALSATSTLGATASATLALTVVPQPTLAAPAAREPVPAGLGFLSPLVTAMGLDRMFGSYAELAFLLFVALLAVLLGFLALSVARSPWVKARVTPSLAVAAPGGIAEFRIQLSSAKARVQKARAVLKSAGDWTASMVRRGQPQPSSQVELTEAGSEGYLRVRVPATARPKDRQSVEFDIVPVDQDGTEHPERAQHAKVTVQASVPMSASGAGMVRGADIRLASVRHEPPRPLPGGAVATTATIRNAAVVPAHLRVVLVVDGKPTAEDRVEVPAAGEASVSLPWTAGSGMNQVKVQVFLA